MSCRRFSTRPALAYRSRCLLAAVLLWAVPGLAVSSEAVSALDRAVETEVVRVLEATAHTLGGQAVIRLDPLRTQRLSDCQAVQAEAPVGRPRARLTVTVRCLAPQPWTLYVQASLQVHGTYYVAARPIDAGQALDPSLLDAQEGDLLSLPPGTLTGRDEAVGAMARYRIGAGQPLRRAALVSALSVQRGTAVRVTAQGRGFSVAGEGRAMADGSPGSLVPVKTASGQVIHGIVRNATTVEIPL